jgi:hypothetical protein
MKRTRVVLLAIGALPLFGGPADAEPILHTFSGIVLSSDIAGIDVGDPVNGWIAFDTTIPDGNPDSNIGTYVDSDYAIGVQVGSFSITTMGTVAWWIWNDCCGAGPLTDEFDLLGTTPELYLAIHGISDDLTQFPDTSVPTMPLSGSDFWFTYILGQGDFFGGVFEASLTSLTPAAAVPEPSAALLLGGGLSVAASTILRRRRRRER